MAEAQPPLTSLESEAIALATTHSKTLAGGRRLFGTSPTHSALEQATYYILKQLHTGEPEKVRQFPYTQWLLDNSHVLRATLREVRKGLPRKFYRQLPTVIGPQDSVRKPRIAALVDKAVEVINIPVELGRFEHFCNAYQTVAPLTIGELWALPAMLRIKLLRHINSTVKEAFRMSASADRAESIEALTSGIAGCITSLRDIAAIQWDGFVERLSRVDAILQQDPARMYTRMDFDTRNNYRNVIERTAIKSKREEWYVAEAVLNLARAARTAERRPREQHVGYFLQDAGLSELMSSLHLSDSLLKKIIAPQRQWRGVAYTSLLSFAAIALCLLFFLWLRSNDTSLFLLIAATVIAAIPALSLSSNLVNALLSRMRTPRRLPKLDFSMGIAPEYRTVVAVPAMLANRAAIDEALHTLELNFLGNSDPLLQFVLLTDYLDAELASSSEDRPLLEYVTQGIDTLNRRYSSEQRQPFVLLHRRRRWNEAADLWMGWERKRGKLQQFNEFLRGADDLDFEAQRGAILRRSSVRYVVTLDADTLAPTGAVARLVGTLAHPLNTAVVDQETGKVKSGYSIVQPRLEINPATSSATVFAGIFSGDVTLDLYTHAVSDIYQDLFEHGIFAGKGIYDVDAFRTTVGSRIPENSVLSHDLLEGLCGRVGLATDIMLLEDYPTNLLAHLKRQHRWTRGDWQLLPWLFACKPMPASPRFWAGIVGGWQLFDNLRRSLVAPALLILLSLGWLFLPVNPWVITALLVTVPGLGLILHALAALRTSTWRWGTARSSVLNILEHTGKDIARWFLTLAFLPVEAFMALDAIGRTLYRLAISRRNLLEWSTAAEVARDVAFASKQEHFWRRMWPGPLWAVINLMLLLVLNPGAMPFATVLLLLWGLSPTIAFHISRPEKQTVRPLAPEDQAYLRRIARGTWRFFEQQVGPDTGWLPPDNIQLEPSRQIARQTSPTNIGFSLLSAAAAYDLGYSGLREYVYNLHHSLQSIIKLEKYRGHLYNWYSLPDSKPLPPRYVSTVDSGNLVAAFIAIRESLIEITGSPISPQTLLDGLEDDFGLIREQLESLHGHKKAKPDRQLLDVMGSIESEMVRKGETGYIIKQLAEVHANALNSAFLQAINTEEVDWTNDEIRDLHTSVSSFNRHSSTALSELRELFPWVLILAEWAEKQDHQNAAASLVNVLLELMTSSLGACPDNIEKACGILGDDIEQQFRSNPNPSSGRGNVTEVTDELQHASTNLRALLQEIDNLVNTLDQLITSTDFRFLYNHERNLFHVGYRTDSAELDSSFYDLLASEARLASFVAIAKGDVPPKHWVHLGRPLTSIKGLRVLLSWSATAFEYLMPRLVMRTPRFGLLAQSCRGAVKQQRAFGRQHQIPWGVSESGYHHFDQHGLYQYQAFGIPRMGLKWDQGERLVISGYAGFLALPYQSSAVVDNARAIESLGGRGIFGFYEALDFGSASLPGGGKPKVVQSYMAHHQGMIMVAITNLLKGDRFVERFHRDPRIASAEHLLYEQLPRRTHSYPLENFEAPLKQASPLSVAIESWSPQSHDSCVAMLANPHVASFVTALGGSTLNWRGFSMTRWTPQIDGMNGGSRLYIRDVSRNLTWSPGSAFGTRDVSMICSPDAVEFRDTQHALLVRQQLVIAPFVDVELRKVSITNDTAGARTLMVCAYSEPVLADAAADARHPAFSKLFIEDRYSKEHDALVFRRRERSQDDPALCLACKIIVQSGYECAMQFETDRREFIGRGGSRAEPSALQASEPTLRSRSGETLDPVSALGFTVTVPARSTFRCAFVSGVGDDEVEVLRNLDQLESIQAVNWVIEDARRHAQQDMLHLQVSSTDVKHASELFANLVLPPRPDADRALSMSAVRRAQSHLWKHGISGDRPLLMIVVSDAANFHGLQDLVRALAVCKARGVTADIVFLDESEGAYSHPTHDRLQAMIRQHLRRTAANRRFATYIVPGYSLDDMSRRAFQISAQLVLDVRQADWYRPLRSHQGQQPVIPGFLPQPSAPVRREPVLPVKRPSNLLSDNGLGGVISDTGEYLVYLENGESTPSPWCNILTNSHFGTLVSESGSSFTWYRNSSEFALTTWGNDPVLDRTGEALYVRDEETGLFWSPMPGPAPDDQPYVVRHGSGYTCFGHNSEGLEQSVSVSVDVQESVKFVRLKLRNLWPRTRRLTITYAAEWRLGQSGAAAGLHLLPEWDVERNTFFVQNAFATGYPDACAFLSCSRPAHGVSFDGDEFLGAERSWRKPAGLQAIGLSGRIAPCASPLAAHQIHVSLTAEESVELHFVLGAGTDRDHAAALAEKACLPDAAEVALDTQKQAWSELLSQVTVDTPDEQLNVMLNRWLPYQAISSRLNGRIGFFQAAGGLGFRDQLQDVLALMNHKPAAAAAHIVRAAAVQFEEGDVLHWWHEDPLRGVRTRCSDDLLWLPYAVSCYLEATRDFAFLDQNVPFLHGLPLGDSEHERYAEFRHGDETGSLYEHCCRAIDARMKFGRHGLPPIGTGDWNDGFSRVGIKGEGESVWMAWFLIDVCRRFEPICRLRNDHFHAMAYRQLRLELQKNVEENAWAGEWYVRGFYDDGSVLGGPGRSECYIDLNAQTWAVIAGGDADRQQQAMQSVETHLLDQEHRLIKLLTPPFESGKQEPGYIKGYPPGVRENGSQYNHAASWALLAAAMSGNGKLALRWLDWLNPLTRANSRQDMEHYRLEPYVLAGDICGHPPYTGRGGWSWYTGSAAWIYRIAIENVLGIERRGSKLFFRPCLPDEWTGFDVTFRYHAATYRIHLHNPGQIDGKATVLVEDGKLLQGTALRLRETGEHDIQVFANAAAWKDWRRVNRSTVMPG